MNPNAAGRPPRMNVPPFPGRDERDVVQKLINDLANPHLRKQALLELSKRRESVPDLGPLLWHSFGSIAILLQEIIGVYSEVHSENFSSTQSNTTCNALALLQCVASHPETRSLFLAANIHRFILPFLQITPKTRPLEFLKLTSLGVIGALVRNDDVEVLNHLLASDIIPLCLHNMETGTELSKTVATFILQKILLYDAGLNYVCQTYERFSHVAMILGKLVFHLANEQPSNLLKHVIHCYLRLSTNPRAREALRQCIPDQMRDNTFFKHLKEDDPTRNWLAQLQRNLESVPMPEPGPMPMPMSMQMPVPDECPFTNMH